MYKINTSTGSTVITGAAVNTNPIGSAFFDITGILYAYDNNGGYGIINLTTGAYTSLTAASNATQSDGASCVFPDQRLGVTKTAGLITTINSTTYQIPYSITLNNPSAVDDPNIQITDNLKTTFSSGNPTFSIVTAPAVTAGTATPNPAFNGNTDTRLLMGSDNLAAGASVTVTFTVQVTYPTAVSVANSTTNTVYATSSSTSANAGYTFGTVTLPPIDVLAVKQPTPPAQVDVADLSVTKTDGVTSVLASNTTTYTVRVTNNGPNSVTGAVLKDGAATGLSKTAVICSTASSNTCTVAPSSATLEGGTGLSLPTLASGAFYELQITANVTGTGSVTNTATVTPPNAVADLTTGNNTASDTNTVIAQPTLNLTKTIAAPGRHVAADQFTVQIKNGASTVVSGTTAGTGTAVTGGTTGITTLAAGTSYTLTEVMAAGSTSALSDYNTSIACTNSNGSSSTVLPSGAGQSFSITPNGNDVISCTLTNTPKQADLQLTKSNSVSSILTGTNTTYTVRVTNNGSISVTGAVLKDAAATGLSKTAVSCSAAAGNTCITAPTIVNLESGTGVTLPALASSAFYEISVTANVTATSGSVVNTATVATPSGITDPDLTNNTASDTDTVTLPYTPTTPAICSALPGYTGTGSNLVTDFTNGTFGVSTSDPLVASTNTRSPAAWPYPAATLNYGYAQVSASGPADGSLSLVNRLSTPRIYNTWSDALTAITVTGTGTGVASSDAATGRFLLINGANPGVTIIQTTISGLTPYTNYQLLGLFSNVIDKGQTGFVLPNIDFYVNGASYFRTGNIPQDVQSTWRRAGFVFNSGNATSATFKLVSRVPASTGNDLAFDQLSLNQCQGVYVNTLSGFLYGDANVNGSFQNPAEPQLPAGVIVDLQYTDSNGNPVTVAKTTTGVGSDTGKYVFTNVPPPPTGYTYFVHVEDGSYSSETTTIPAGYTLLSPNNAAIAVTPDYVSGTNIGPDFGFNFADLGVTKSNGVTGLLMGSSTTYTIRVTNNGSISVTGAVLKDAAATGLTKTAVSCSAAAGNTCTTAPTIVNLESGTGVTLPALARGAFYEINVTANVTAAAGLTVTNTATITVPAGITDTAAGNNSASDSDLISAVSTTTLALSKTGAAIAQTTSATAVPNPNSDVVYTITVQNTGAVPALNVTISDPIPAGTTFKNATGTAVTAGSPVVTGVTWTIGTLAPSANASVTLTLSMPTSSAAIAAGRTSVTNTATASSSTASNAPTASQDTKLVIGTLTKEVRNLTKTGAFGTVATGLPTEVLEYCINFRNDGGVDLPNFVVTDALPPNVTALTTGYDAEEPSAVTGYGVKQTVTRVTPPVAPSTTPTSTTTTSYLLSSTNLSSSGGTYGRGTLTVNLGTLNASENGRVCFKATIR